LPLENRDLCVGFTSMGAELVGSNTEAETEVRSIYSKYHSFYKDLLELGHAREENCVIISILMRQAHVIIAAHNGMLLEWYRKPR